MVRIRCSRWSGKCNRHETRAHRPAFSSESTYNAFFQMGRLWHSRRSDRVRKAAKLEEAAYHS
jgi:hypothetical protein